MGFVEDLHRAYVKADARVRRQINQAMFEGLVVSDDGDLRARLQAPVELLLEASGTAEGGVVRVHT